MALPSRVYVGVVVFGLIASIVTATYTGLILSGYEPPSGPLLPGFEEDPDIAKKMFLVLSTLLSIGFTVFAWRRLLAAARHDADVRRKRAELAKAQRAYRREQEGRQRPPGYN